MCQNNPLDFFKSEECLNFYKKFYLVNGISYAPHPNDDVRFYDEYKKIILNIHNTYSGKSIGVIEMMKKGYIVLDTKEDGDVTMRMTEKFVDEVMI